MNKMNSIVFCTLLLVGCATHGNKIDTDFTSQLKKGVTTEADIRENLGTPQNVSMDAQGNKSLTYVYAKSQVKAESFIPIVGSFMGGADTESKSLLIIIDGNTNILKDYFLNESQVETRTGLGTK